MMRFIEKTTEFKKELESLLNRYSKENGSNTPDFILADYLIDCLKNFDKTTSRRDKWYLNGKVHSPGQSVQVTK